MTDKKAGTAWTGESTLKDFAALEPAERVGLALTAGPWSVIRRLGEAEAPEPTSIFFGGSLLKLAVPDVLSLVHSTGLEGELLFAFPDAVKRVYLRGGGIVFASSTLQDDRLGEMLLARGRIDRRLFTDASTESVRDKKKLGRVLVDRKILSAHDLYESVTEQLEGIVLSLFTYVEGSFAFTARTVPIANPIRLPHAVSHYILEGVRLNDELRPALDAVSDRLVTLRPTGKSALAVADGRPGVERDVAALLDGVSPVWEVLARSTWSEANTLLALARLLRAGLIERVKPSEIRPPAGPGVDPAVATGLVERVNDFLRDVTRSVTAYGGDPRALNGFFDGLKPALRGLFGRERMSEDGALDAGRIGRNLASIAPSAADGMRLLREGLQEVVEFALWVASDQVPEKEATRLSGLAVKLREGQGS